MPFRLKITIKQTTLTPLQQESIAVPCKSIIEEKDYKQNLKKKKKPSHLIPHDLFNMIKMIYWIKH